MSADKEKILALAENGQELRDGKALVKDPFVLEFLDIKENTNYDLYRVEDTQELIVSAVPEEKIYKNYFEDFDEEIKLIKI